MSIKTETRISPLIGGLIRLNIVLVGTSLVILIATLLINTDIYLLHMPPLTISPQVSLLLILGSVLSSGCGILAAIINYLVNRLVADQLQTPANSVETLDKIKGNVENLAGVPQHLSVVRGRLGCLSPITGTAVTLAITSAVFSAPINYLHAASMQTMPVLLATATTSLQPLIDPTPFPTSTPLPTVTPIPTNTPVPQPSPTPTPNPALVGYATQKPGGCDSAHPNYWLNGGSYTCTSTALRLITKDTGTEVYTDYKNSLNSSFVVKITFEGKGPSVSPYSYLFYSDQANQHLGSFQVAFNTGSSPPYSGVFYNYESGVGTISTINFTVSSLPSQLTWTASGTSLQIALTNSTFSTTIPVAAATALTDIRFGAFGNLGDYSDFSNFSYSPT